MTEVFTQKLIVAGEPKALILDYLDTTAYKPTIDGYYSYKRSEENSFNSQVRWDALNNDQGGLPSQKPIDGFGIASLMNHLR